MVSRPAPPDRPPPAELLAFLAPFPADVGALVTRLRERVLETMPNAREVIWDATNAVSLVYTPTERWQDGICHIATYATYANLGFNQGAALDDPAGVLRGTGVRIRHATFRSVRDAGAAWIPRYLKAALAHAGVDATAGDGGTTIRVSNGPKRRPGPP